MGHVRTLVLTYLAAPLSLKEVSSPHPLNPLLLDSHPLNPLKVSNLSCKTPGKCRDRLFSIWVFINHFTERELPVEFASEPSEMRLQPILPCAVQLEGGKQSYI